MEIRDMLRTDWRRILEREYVSRNFSYNGLRARESLMLIKKVAAPLAIKSGNETVTVVDVGYSWIQTAVEGKPIWLTAMFDPSGGFIQAYFDVTAGNSFENPDNPTFRDMYLDVVLTPKAETFVLDEDELDDALTQGDITREEYKHAQTACKRLCDWLREHKDETIRYCAETYIRLKNGL